MAETSVDNRGGVKDPVIVAANIVVIVLATTAVVSRGVARYMQRVSLKADDYLMIVALVSCSSMLLVCSCRVPSTDSRIKLLGWGICTCAFIGKHLLNRSSINAC